MRTLSFTITASVLLAASSTTAGDVQDAYLQWPLPTGAKQYADIDGRRMLEDVVAQVEISRRYRDDVHPKYWGRIIGTSSDAESAKWLQARYEAIGLSDIHIQPFDLAPQWRPQTYEVTVTAGDMTIELTSAQPVYRSFGTSPEGLELEAAYVGLGNEADFLGRDVAGKAVFSYSMFGLGNNGALARADAKAAAAIFDSHMLPGNMRYQAYPKGTSVPTFTLGGDDASGVASMIWLAEHFAKIPLGEHRRTLVFLGIDGHHNSGEGMGIGRQWLLDNRTNLFSKTALMINVEHPSTVLTVARPRYAKRLTRGFDYGDGIYWTNTYTGQQWYAGGAQRPELTEIAANAFREFGVSTYLEPLAAAPAGDLSRLFRLLPGLATSDFNHYFHSDMETPETVPWTGLEATTRAYARIIDEVNKHDLSVFQRPEEPVP